MRAQNFGCGPRGVMTVRMFASNVPGVGWSAPTDSHDGPIPRPPNPYAMKTRASGALPGHMKTANRRVITEHAIEHRLKYCGSLTNSLLGVNQTTRLLGVKKANKKLCPRLFGQKHDDVARKSDRKIRLP